MQGLLGGLARAADAVQFQRQHDVLDGGQGLDQMKGLEDEAQMLPAQTRSSVLVQAGQVLPAQDDPPFGRLVQSGQQGKQRGLAGSGRTHQGVHQDSPLCRREVDILENLKVPLGAGGPRNDPLAFADMWRG